MQYLLDRGITGDVAQHFRFGYVAEPLENHDPFRGWLSIPYLTPTGVSAIRFRRITGDGHKYSQESGSFTPLFNVRDLHTPKKHVAVCEGEFDAAVMSQLVGVPAIGIPGTGQWGKRGKFYARLLQDFDKVFVVVDPDKAGQDLVPGIVRAVANPVHIILPADVNDTYLLHGKDYILKEMGLWESSEMLLSA